MIIKKIDELLNPTNVIPKAVPTILAIKIGFSFKNNVRKKIANDA